INFDDAQSIFLGYLFLKPKYEDLREAIRKENYKNNLHHTTDAQVAERFLKEYDSDLDQVIKGNVSYDQIGNLKEQSTETLKAAFDLLPQNTKNKYHKRFIKEVFNLFSIEIFKSDDKLDYKLRHSFLEKVAHFILFSKKDEIQEYIQPKNP
ncbi:MAG: hypothetical protein ACOCW8_02080, partial [bacterium]